MGLHGLSPLCLVHVHLKDMLPQKIAVPKIKQQEDNPEEAIPVHEICC
jgi:hypothetical protein